MQISYIQRYSKAFWHYLDQDNVIEIAINPDGRIWVERHGDHHMMLVEETMTANDIAQLTKQIAGQQKTVSGINNPITSAMIETDGLPVRIQCVLPPACMGAGSITIRKFSKHEIPASGISMISAGKMSSSQSAIEEIKSIFEGNAGSFEDVATIIVESKLTVMVSGGTGSGKTTVLKALLAKVPKEERIITIEDVPELMPSSPNYVGLITDRDSKNRGPKDLLASVLRMRPDRFLMGELRGDEARMFMEAINTGHSGSLTTMHANTAEKAINRLILMGLGGAANISPRVMVSNICDTIDLVLQSGRNGPKRGIVGYYVPAEHAKELREKF